jgi:hypothetical protein
MSWFQIQGAEWPKMPSLSPAIAHFAQRDLVGFSAAQQDPPCAQFVQDDFQRRNLKEDCSRLTPKKQEPEPAKRCDNAPARLARMKVPANLRIIIP